MAKATYGQLWAFWPFLADATGTVSIGSVAPDQLIFVGEKVGKGIAFRWGLSGDPLNTTSTVITGKFVNTTDANTATISAPAGGVGQFKGLAQSTQQDKYVRVICKGVAPMYAATYPVSLDSGSNNGWVLSCYTGISSCVSQSSNMTLTILDNVNATESTDCMNDPRYLTWRLMTLRIKIDGTVSWYRVDSYWNSASTSYSSTWGPGLIMSTAWLPAAPIDNYTTSTDKLGKTFVFAYSDGSGIQFNHINFGTVAASTATTQTQAGTGVNLITAPTSFSNTSPNMVNENYCNS